MNKALLFAVLALGSCCLAPNSPASRLSEVDYPWDLVSPERLPDGLFWRQKIQARFDGREESFEAVLQKSGREMLVLGFTPMGTKAFALRQNGLDSSFENFVDLDLPFPARFILVDIQRCFFPLADPPASGASLERSFEIGLEQVRESWRGGRLQARSFERPGQAEGTRIQVIYEDWSADGRIPGRVVLENGWFGYELVIQTAKGD